MKNFIQEGKFLAVACSSPAAPNSGDVVRFGHLAGVAVTDEGDGTSVATETSVRVGGGVYALSVTDTATGGIAAGAKLWMHDGSPPTVDNVSTAGYFFGYALQVISTGATATINVLHVPGGETVKVVDPAAAVSPQAATATLTSAIAGKILTNTGAGAAIVLTLPAAAAMANQVFRLAVLAAFTVTLTPVAGTAINLNGSAVASKYCLVAAVVSNFVDVWCDGVAYFVQNYSGVVTKEA